MKLSIIIPIYNMEEYLVECLDSVVCQSSKDFEVICVDDGSTDNSFYICNQYVSKYNYISVFTKENGGLSSARNYGMERAKSNYLMFLDADDMLYSEDCIEFIINHIEEHSLDMLLFDGKSFLDNKEGTMSEFYKKAYIRSRSYGLFDKGYKLFKEMVRNGEYYVSAYLYCINKEFLKDNNLTFVEGQIYEDNLFTFKAILQANTVEHCNKTVISRRIHSGSIMQSQPSINNYYSLVDIYESMEIFVSHYLYIEQIEKEILTIFNSIRCQAISIYKRLSNEELDKIEEMPLTFRNKINIMFTPNNFEMSGFNFPFYLFNEHSKIIIYGAGAVGKEFYLQGMADSYVDIVGIADTNAKNITDSNINILSPKQIISLNYDYILIAVENRDIAASIKDDLIDMGVTKEKIMWDGNYYRSKNLNKLFFQRDKFLVRNVINKKKILYLFMIPEHGNIGDYAIAYAEEQLIRKYFSEFNLITISLTEWSVMEQSIRTNVRDDSVIAITGGGFFGDIWSSGMRSKEIAEAFPNNKVIFLPNNLTYRECDWYNSSSVMADMDWLKQHNNVFIFLREKVSYEFIKNYTERCFLAPDMAMLLHFPNIEKKRHNKILLILRNDSEKSFIYEKDLKRVLNENGISYDEDDIHQGRYVSWEEGKKILDEIVKKIQKYDLVITDRLHGMILSTIAEVPCMAYDNSTKKISRTYEWIKNSSKTVFMDKFNEESLLDTISFLYEDSECRYEVPISAFENMVICLKNIITI